MEILKAQNLTKIYDNQTVLNNVSFEVEKGEFLSILGPSGCGKTTLLRILIGLLKPDKGNLFLNGEDITNNSPDKRKMGIVFQNYALFENMTVRKNIEYAMKIRSDLKNSARERANELMQQVSLTEHTEKYPSQLSGGQQQRVAIARTLALNPDIVLFDEPMSALDVDTRLSLRAELKNIQKTIGTTMIYITHDQEEAFAMSDRIMVMGNAVIHQIGSPDEILKSPADDYVSSFVVDNLKIKIDSLAKYMK